MSSRWLTRTEVAARRGVKVKSLDDYLWAGTFPRADRYIGRMPQWHVTTLERWERADPKTAEGQAERKAMVEASHKRKRPSGEASA